MQLAARLIERPIQVLFVASMFRQYGTAANSNKDKTEDKEQNAARAGDKTQGNKTQLPLVAVVSHLRQANSLFLSCTNV